VSAARYAAAHLFDGDRWLSPGYLEIGAEGLIALVAELRPAHWTDAEVERLEGFVVPGIPNLHSHSYHRAYSLFAQAPTGAFHEDLWSWRAGLYELARRITPDQLEAIAAQAFLDMLRAGFTSVGEFHYLHNDPAGKPYANVSELSERILGAAEAVGIAITLLPVLYRQNDFDQPLVGAQHRFGVASVDAFGALMTRLQKFESGRVFLGVAPHSVRAVGPSDLNALVALRTATFPGAPIHIHVAEQVAEVRRAEALLGLRPIAWLLEHFGVDSGWTLVHATHATSEELGGLARSGATVAVCPTTEADLGDGLFGLGRYAAAGGGWGIGSDANIAIDPALELRTLIYGQRLRRRRRDAITGLSTGRDLLAAALRSGARSLGQPIGRIAVGRRADLVELDPSASELLGHTIATVLDAWVFGAASRAVRRVMVAGQWRITGGDHPEGERIGTRFDAAVHALR